MSLLVIYRSSERGRGRGRGRGLEQLEDFGCVRIKIPDAPYDCNIRMTPPQPPPPALIGSYLAVDFI